MSSSDKAAAEALFDQGVRLMKQNSFSDACPKLEESERIDPAVGTLLYLGECYERVGKGWLATKVSMYSRGVANQVEEYSNWKVDQPVSAQLFDLSAWTTAPHWAKP